METGNIIADKSFSFSIMIIELYKKMSEQKEYVLAKQVLRSGTSIGANIHEGLSAFSKQDFLYKLTIALKESRETEYWLKLIRETKLIEYDFTILFDEITQLLKILTSIINKTKKNLIVG